MGTDGDVGRTWLRRLTSDEGLPDRAGLPRHLAPVPERLENLGLRFAWAVVAVNLLGTAFGFWYYRFQFAETPTALLPLVPDSPAATLLFAAAVATWKLGRPQEWLIALAFVGNVVLGAWTPFVLLLFGSEFPVSIAMWNFLFWSHLAMVAQAFVLHRIGDFPTRAVAVAAVWYGLNLVVDYFVPVLGDHPHHTAIPVDPDHPVALGAEAHDVVAAGAVTLVIAALVTAMAIGRALDGLQRDRSTAGPEDPP